MGDIVDLLYKSAFGNTENASDKVSPQQTEEVLPEDQEIAEVAMKLGVRIKILGCGGGGTNTINRLSSEGIVGASLIAINTDVAHLATIKARHKVLIGKKTTRGLGCGAVPQIGEESVMEDLPTIQKLVQKADISFVTCGLGGGTGTGSAPIVAKSARDAGSLVISIVTLPFTAEGRVRMENAVAGLEKISNYSDTVIVIPNDRLLKLVPTKPIQEAFHFADSVLAETMKGITELITKTGIVNLDYADIKTIMKDGGVAMVGVGMSQGGQNRVMNALNEAIASPLVEADISQAKNCLIRVVGGSNMSIGEAHSAMAEIKKKIDKDARIIWGASAEPEMGDAIKVLLLLTGVKSPYMISGGRDVGSIRKIIGVGNDESSVEFVK